jgi:hypothetical protein
MYSVGSGILGFATGGLRRMSVGTCTMVSQTTARSGKTVFETGDDTSFINTCAQVYYNNSSITCTANNTWYRFGTTSSTTVKNSSFDTSNGVLTISVEGAFRVEYSVSFYATVGHISRFSIFKNDAVINESIREMFHASSAGSSFPRTVSGSFLSFHANDTAVTYDLRGQCSAGATQNIQIINGTLIVHRI